MTTLQNKRLAVCMAAVLFVGCILDPPGCYGAEGTVVPVENAILKTIDTTRVAAEVAGKISELNVREGEQVGIGQLLGKIRDSAVKLQLERASIAMAVARTKHRSNVELRLAKKRAEVAHNELSRAEEANARLASTYSIKEIDRLRLVASSADIEIERVEHDHDLLGLEVMMAENDYKQVEDLLSRHQIASTADGVVVSVNHRVGEWVEPGTELFEIVRINRLRIEGFVQQEAVRSELVGLSARVIVMQGDVEQEIYGKVVFVSPDANPINGLIRIHLEIENPQNRFRPGMRVRVEIDQQ